MTSSDKKTPSVPIPKSGRVFGDVADLPGYRRDLRYAVPVVEPGKGDVVGPTPWTPESSPGAPPWQPLFEVLGGEDPPPPTPEEQRALIQEEARSEGFDRGFEEARATVETLLARYEDAIDKLDGARKQVLAETEVDVVNLALLIAREAIGAEDTNRSAFTEKMVSHCLGLLRSADKITLRVGSAETEAVRARSQALASERTVVRVIEDAEITLGVVIAECSLGRVDATLERRVRDMGVQLLGDQVYSGEDPVVPVEPDELKEPGGGETDD